jgi:hypothetical protein
MKNYSIVRVGNTYVVHANEKGILKIASRRRAARLVSDAAELLVSHHDVRITEPPDQPSPVTPGMIADTPQHN